MRSGVGRFGRGISPMHAMLRSVRTPKGLALSFVLARWGGTEHGERIEVKVLLSSGGKIEGVQVTESACA